MLRTARAEDEQALLPIYTHELVERFLTFDGVDAQRYSDIFRNLLKGGDFFVYEADRMVVGFCKATRLPGRSSHVAHIGPLAVSPEFHGRGYAAAMLRCWYISSAAAHYDSSFWWRPTIPAALLSTRSSDSSAKAYNGMHIRAPPSNATSMRS